MDVELALVKVIIEAPGGDGSRKGSIEFDGVLKVRGDVELSAREGELGIEFRNLEIELAPEDPDPGSLTGGPEDAVEDSERKFHVAVVGHLPGDWALRVKFSKEPEEFIPDEGAVFSLAASQAVEDGVIDDPEKDIAFSVRVTRGQSGEHGAGGQPGASPGQQRVVRRPHWRGQEHPDHQGG